MTFGFYLKDHKDYIKFEKWMEKNKKNFGEHWIFSHMDTKPTYLKSKIPVRQVRIDAPARKSHADSVDEFDILATEPDKSGREEEKKEEDDPLSDDGFDIL